MMSPSRTARPQSETAFQAHNFIFQLDDFGLEPLFIFLNVFLYFCQTALLVIHYLSNTGKAEKVTATRWKSAHLSGFEVQPRAAFRSVHGDEGVPHLSIGHLYVPPFCRWFQKTFRRASNWDQAVF